MAHVYKVGDKVRIKKKEGNAGDYPFSFVNCMARQEGNVFTIKKIRPSENNIQEHLYYNGDNNEYTLEGDDWVWHSSMFEPVLEEEQLKVSKFEVNREITVVISDFKTGIKYYFNGIISKNSLENKYFILFNKHLETCKNIKVLVNGFSTIAESYGGNTIYEFPVFPTLKQLKLFILAISAQKLGDSINKQSQIKKDNENNEIRFQKSKASLVRGTVPEGRAVCGRRNKTAVVIGHLSNRACDC